MKINQLMGALAVCAIAPLASAESSVHLHSPYVGAEAIQTNQDYKAHHGKNVFKKNPQDYSIFAGAKFNRHFGAELGYEFQPKKKKTIGAGTSYPIPEEDDLFDEGFETGTVTSRTSVKGSHPYLGVFGESSFGMHRMRFQGMIGASVSRVKITNTILSKSGTAPADIVVGSTMTGSKTKVVPMVKLSGIYDVTKNFGVRVSLNYRNLSSVKIKIDQDTTGKQLIKLRDTFGVGVGLTYSF